MINITNSINNKQMFECGYVCGRKLMPLAIMLSLFSAPREQFVCMCGPIFINPL